MQNASKDKMSGRRRCYVPLLYAVRRNEQVALRLLDNKTWREMSAGYLTLAQEAVMWWRSAAVKAARSPEIAELSGSRGSVAHIIACRWPEIAESEMTDRLLSLKDKQGITVRQTLMIKLNARKG